MEITKDIQFNSNPIANNPLTINYQGFLKDSGELTIVYGFNESWENTTEAKMEKTENGFSVQIELLNFDTFNFCFKDNNGTWDNNSNCNYISTILSCENEEKSGESIQDFDFDIDKLIEELLEPIYTETTKETENITSAEIETNPIDLGVEISNILSGIDYQPELVEYDTLDEILSGTVISETPVQLEETSVDEIVNELIENTVNKEATLTETPEEINTFETETEKSLITLEDPFIVSSRQVSKFYLIRKRIKLAFYKALIKIPKMIFGLEED